MIEPSYALDLGNDSTAPKQSLLLTSVRGIRSQGLTRGALAYNRSGGLVYPAATLGVVYNRTEHRCSGDGYPQAWNDSVSRDG